MGKHIEIVDDMPVEVDDQKWADDPEGVIAYIREKKAQNSLSDIEELEAEDGFYEIGKDL